MMAWLSALPALIVAVALVTLPGAPAAILLRLRGTSLVAASVAASVAIVALASIVAPLFGLSWGLAPVALIALVLAAAVSPVWFFTRKVKHSPTFRNREFLFLASGIAVASMLIAWQLTRAIGAPENLSQSYDGVFHANAIGQIILTGDASPFHMNIASPGSSGGFYPTVWHALGALVVQLTGVSVPVASNVLVLTAAAWIWPIAIIFFTRPFIKSSFSHFMATGLAAGSFTAFPYLLVAWGVLYPNLLSTAMIPLALGFLHLSLRPRPDVSETPRVSVWIATFGALGAASLAHPNALFGFIALSLPLLVSVALGLRNADITLRSKLLKAAGLLVSVAIAAILWSKVRTGDNAREYGRSVWGAFINGISNAQMVDTRMWFLTVLVLAGAVFAIICKSNRWIVGSYVVALALFVISSGFSGSIRDAFTGAWYNDAHRLAALIPLIAVPLAAIAITRVLDYALAGAMSAMATSGAPRAQVLLKPFLVATVLLLVFTGSHGQNFVLQSGWIAQQHEPNGYLLSQDERDLLDRLPAEVPEGAVIAGDPWTGAGLALAISNRAVLFPHLVGTYSLEAQDLGRDFLSLGDEACPLLSDLGITHVLDFGFDRYSVGQDALFDAYSGLHDLDESPVLSELDRQGDAVLFKVTCS